MGKGQARTPIQKVGTFFIWEQSSKLWFHFPLSGKMKKEKEKENKFFFFYNNFTLHMIGLPHIYRDSMHEAIVQETASTMFFSCTYSFFYVMHNHFPLFPLHYPQYARIVREALCELELPYILQNVGNGSPRTKLLVDISGSKEVCLR